MTPHTSIILSLSSRSCEATCAPLSSTWPRPRTDILTLHFSPTLTPSPRMLSSITEPGITVTPSIRMLLVILTFSLMVTPWPRLTPVRVVLSAMLQPEETWHEASWALSPRLTSEWILFSGFLKSF